MRLKQANTITLSQEIETIDGRKTKVIQVREPKRGDYKAARKYDDEVMQEDILISRLCNIPLDEIDNLAMSDSIKITDAIERLTGTAPDPKS